MAELEVPSWLDRHFLESCLRDGDHLRQIKVSNYTVLPAVPKGNNYSSTIYRVNLKLKDGSEDEKPFSIIVKAPVIDPVRVQLFDVYQDTEARFYYQVLSKASRITDLCFAPKSYVSSVPDAVVLEDLTKRDFKLADRLRQLDFEHCRQYAIASASFHAVTVAVHRTDLELIESLGQEKLYRSGTNLSDVYKSFIGQGLRRMAEYMDKTEFKKYSTTVRRVEPTLFDMVEEAHKPRKELNSLNQGDPWTTNMMFRYNKEGGVCEARLLDFQAIRYASPINDLMFFFWTSANREVRENRREEFFRVYQESLNSKLKQLRCPEVLTDQELLDAVEALSPLALMVVACFVPMQVLPNPLDLEELPMSQDESEVKEVDNTLANCYTEQYCNNFLRSYLGVFESTGVFRYLEQNIKQ